MPEVGESHDTIGSLLRGRNSVRICCDVTGCHHSQEVDLSAWAKKFGEGFNIIENNRRIRARLVCARCGAKGRASFRIAPPAAGLGESLRQRLLRSEVIPPKTQP